MMRGRFFDFFLVDDNARWRAILWSWLAGSTAGAIAAFGTRSLNTLAFVTVGVELLAFGSFVFLYVEQRQGMAIVAPRRMFLQYVYAAVATCLFIAVKRILTSPETVHAAALSIESNMDGNNFISENRLAMVRTAIDVITKKKNVHTREQQITWDYSVVSAASAYNVALTEISKHPQSRILGLTFHLMPVVTGGIEINASSMLEDVTVIAENPVSKGVIVDCTSCAVVVLRGRFEHLTQELDFATWFKCHFVNCTISYAGARVTLVQCEFDSCTFEFSPSTSSEMRRMIMSGTAVSPLPSTLQ